MYASAKLENGGEKGGERIRRAENETMDDSSKMREPQLKVIKDPSSYRILVSVCKDVWAVLSLFCRGHFL